MAASSTPTGASQFRSRPYIAALHHHGLVGSMGRVASSADNAAMVSTATPKSPVLARWKSPPSAGLITD